VAFTDYSFYKNSLNTGDISQGQRKSYSSLSDPSYKDPSVGDTSNVYFRNYYGNTGLVKTILNDSKFQNLDGSKAISFRIDARIEAESTNRQILFLAKTDDSDPERYSSNWQNTPGYKIGFRCLSTSTTYGIFDSNSTTTNFETNINPDFWYRIRVDITPVLDVNGTIVGDKIDYYRSIYNSSTWTLNNSETLTINSADSRFIPWGDSTYNKYGFQIVGWYIDNFQVYISN